MIVLFPFLYLGAVIFEGLLIGTALVLWVGLYLVIFCAALLFALVRTIFRSSWPLDPRRPHRPRFTQARYSDRR